MWTVEGTEGGEHEGILDAENLSAEYVEANAEDVRTYARVHPQARRQRQAVHAAVVAEHAWNSGDQDFNRPFTTQNATSSAESIKRMDAKIGQIMALLEELGIAENTLIIAMADNGPMLKQSMAGDWAERVFFRGGKNDVTEGGVRVPAFAYWPGVIEPGSDSRRHSSM